MIDIDDIGDAALYGGLVLFIIFVILYFAFSLPEIEACHERGGVIVKVEGEDRCVAKTSFKEL